MIHFTPDRITKLAPGQIFVFGSNVQGVHGAGAAKDAARLFGAKRGIGIGFTGQCYAIPTRSYKAGGFTTLPLKVIRNHVQVFLADAAQYHQNLFLVTQIGCGYAGLSADRIAPMFKGHPENVILPKAFHEILHPEPKDQFHCTADHVAIKCPGCVHCQ